MSSASEDEETKCRSPDPSAPQKIRLARGDVGSKKQKHRIQKYRVEWERDPQCLPWVGPDRNNDTRAWCNWCNASLIADISLIKTHKTTKKHEKNAAAYGCSSPNLMSKFFKPQDTYNALNKITKKAGIKICGFMAAHNIPYAVVNDLIPCLKSALPDSKILEGVYMKRLKATKIVTNVIACIVVRYYDEELGQITSKFWDLTSVFPEDDTEAAEEGATGRRLYDLLIKAFTEKGVPLENILGFGCDGASVNVGVRNSMASRLQESCPGVIIMKCICHSLHIAASNACTMHMPRSCEALARDVHTYVQHSAKRVASLAVFQKFLNVAVHKILHPAQTRWLSLLSVVNRMLEQWEPLRLYFMERHMEERTLAAESIFIWLGDPFVKLFYLFLSWVLPKVVTMNAYFQSDSVVITSLAQKMELAFRELLTAYMMQEYVAVTPLSKINTENSSKFLPLRNMYLGVQVLDELKKPEVSARPDLIDNFYMRCRNFLAKLSKGIQERFDFDNLLLKMLPLLHPSKALSRQERNKSQSLIQLCDNVPRAKPKDLQSLQRLDDEWRRLPLDDIPEDIVKETEVDVFGIRFRSLKIVRTVINIKYNLVKTKTRNRLTIKNVEGAMLASQSVKINKSCCAGFEPTKDMLDRMTSEILYDTPNKQEKSSEEDSNVCDFGVVFEEV
ncbi:putative zinc finger protein 862 [Lasius niger]|uniref:Putative zinc finger protein 862 n=1 Tax=Lasius niger TaxID=67767 RepID=A0A0J7K8S3_LASNI|nr:putative zinc finger protein 862 [Lasius niger]